MKKNNLIVLGIIVVLIILAIAVTFTREFELADLPEKQPVELPALQPLPEAMRGEQIYNVMVPEDQRFWISQVIINPLDVAIGQTQTVTVLVEDLDGSDITEENRVTATAFTDNGSKVFYFELKEVYDKDLSLFTVWQGSWQLQDTYNHNYQLAIQAFKELTQDSKTITFR